MPNTYPARAARGFSLSLIGILGLSACADPGEELDTTPDATQQSTPTEADSATPGAGPDTEEGNGSGEAALTQQGVSTGHPQATAAAAEVLAAGGNAVDAAVTAAFAMGVVEPFASGLGGGGSAIIAQPGAEPVFYDYREQVNTSGQIPASGIGVPGFAAGMDSLLEDQGSIGLAEAISPAQGLAQEGVVVSDFLQARMTQDFGPEAISGLNQFQGLSAGDTLIQADLAQTLGVLAEEGAQSFYTGGLATSLTEQVEGLDAETLAEYEVAVSETVSGEFGDYQVIGAAPALPGAAFIQLLQVAEASGIAQMEPGSAEYIGTLSAAWEVALETTETQLGDQRFVEVDTEAITDPTANAQLAGEISASGLAPAGQLSPEETSTPGAAGQPERPAPAQRPAPAPAERPAPAGQPVRGMQADPNTTHISIVDDEGMAVSMTNTVTNFWGSQQAVDGYFLNNQLSRFGQIESRANTPQPGKRSVTWSNPAMLLDEDARPVLVLGTPGGEQILSSLSQVVIQWGLQGRDLAEAIDSPRFRFDPESATLFAEQGIADNHAAAVQQLGWGLEVWPQDIGGFGSVSALEIDQEAGTVSSADDPRRDGAHEILDAAAPSE